MSRFTDDAKKAQREYWGNLNPFDEELLERAYPDAAPQQLMTRGCLGCLWLVAFPVLFPYVLVRWLWRRITG